MNKLLKISYLSILGLSITSCDFFKKDLQQDAVARAGNSYLYKEDIKKLVPDGTPKDDSLHIVKTYVDRWATQKLLTSAAEINLDRSLNRFCRYRNPTPRNLPPQPLLHQLFFEQK